MPYEMIKFAKNAAIATVTLNRPEKYNTLRIEMIQELENALMDANHDDAIKVIVLEGAGDSFCGGFDFSGVWSTSSISKKSATTRALISTG